MGDVEMVDATHSPAAPATRDVLNLLTTGQIDALASFAAPPSAQNPPEATQHEADADAERDLLAPFLPLLTRVHEARRASSSSPSSLTPLLTRYDHVNELREYTTAVQTLTIADLESFAPETTDATPVSRQFEGADARERACIVLHLVLAFSSGAIAPDALHENELVRNDIYKPHVAAILINALTADALVARDRNTGISVASVVRFCLAVPLGVELIEALVLNDPSSFIPVIDVIVQSIHTGNPLQQAASDGVGASSASASSLLPFALRQAQAVCSALAALSPSYAMQVVWKLRDDVTSVAAAFVAFQLIVELPILRGNDHFYATFVLQWLRLSSNAKTASSPALHVFLQASLSREGDAQSEQEKQGIQAAAATFLEEARYVMSQFRQFLIEDLVQFRLAPSSDVKSPSRFAFTAMLNVLIGFLVIGRLHPEDHETTQLLKLFDKITKDIPQLQPPVAVKSFERMISLMYVLLLLLCSPSAPAFAKMPSQREDSTKLVLQLAQQCIYSLYNTKAACPLFILSSVLLYTKSPSLLPFLTSFLGETVPINAATVRVENLHGVGDAILKPILTENVMAREVLTTFEPARIVSAEDHDAMEEMVLRSIHGLLSEKSFLRHHHGRKLEEWITMLLDRATTPIHPLIVGVLFEWIENYVMAFEYPIAQRPLLQLAVIPLSPVFVSRSLGHAALTKPFTLSSRREWAKAALVLIYALQFNQRIRVGSAMAGSKLAAFANQGASDGTDQHTVPMLRGSSDILLSYDLDAYPLKNIVSQVSQFSTIHGLFEFAAPTLCRLMADEYPQLVVEEYVPVGISKRSVRSVSRKHKLVLEQGDSPDQLPVVSWTKACMWLHDLHAAPSPEVEEAVHLCISALLPVAVLSLEEKTSSSVGSEAFLAVFSDFYINRTRKEAADPLHLDKRIAEALCMPQLVWRHYQQTESMKAALAPAVVTKAATPSWIPRGQLVEQPFYVLQNAYAGVLSCTSVLRLVLDLVKRCREECIFQLRRREGVALLARKAAQGGDASGGAAVSSAVPSSDPATQQFLVVQDCILVQSMLALVTQLTNSNTRQERDECVFVLFKAIDELLAEAKAGSSTPITSPPIALLIHTQGYDPSLVGPFVDQVSSLKQLWVHWMHQPAVDGSSKNSSDRRAGSSTTPSHAAVKAIADFVNDSSTEKDFAKWHFRVRVFFKLCEKYFVSPAHTAAALQTIKQILNRLRGIAVSSCWSSKGVLHAMSIGDSAARVAFVEAVMNDAIDGCGPYPELRVEIVQFLLNLKKHLGPATTGQNQTATSPKGVENAGPKTRDHHQDIERVVFRAYQRVLQLA